jgi:regulatory protein
MSLRTKGFPAEAITAALSEIDADSELEAAKRIAVTRIRQLMKLDPDVRSRRLAGFLTRKGYSSSIVWAAVKHASSESSD